MTNDEIIVEGCYDLGYYCLDQPIAIGRRMMAWIARVDGSFHFMNNLPSLHKSYEPYDIEVFDIQHAILGRVAEIKIDLSYTIVLSDGSSVMIDSEQCPGFIERGHQLLQSDTYMKSTRFIVSFWIRQRTNMINLQDVLLSGTDALLRYNVLRKQIWEAGFSWDGVLRQADKHGLRLCFDECHRLSHISCFHDGLSTFLASGRLDRWHCYLFDSLEEEDIGTKLAEVCEVREVRHPYYSVISGGNGAAYFYFDYVADDKQLVGFSVYDVI